ncbi:DUF4158 domain-containing protein [Nonomuraea jabiensis]|uniref:DUF4158 domain-containing protein n=1 Tax=Nonomuraea jabiensis TaxID=882448 RepID=UPI0035E4000E
MIAAARTRGPGPSAAGRAIHRLTTKCPVWRPRKRPGLILRNPRLPEKITKARLHLIRSGRPVPGSQWAFNPVWSRVQVSRHVGVFSPARRRAVLANKSGAARFGFGLMLKFFELEARFPRREDIPRPAVEFMAGQVKVDAALFAAYDWSGRTIEYHRAQIRKFHHFRESTVSSRRRRPGSNACWARPRRCASGTSPPRPCSACRSSRSANWKS